MNDFSKYLIVIGLMAMMLGVGFWLGKSSSNETSSDKMVDIELIRWEYQTMPLTGDPVLLVSYKISNIGKVDLKSCIMGIIIEYNDEIVTDYGVIFERHNIIEDFEVSLKPGEYHFNYTVIEDLIENLPLISFESLVIKDVQIDNWLIK